MAKTKQEIKTEDFDAWLQNWALDATTEGTHCEDKKIKQEGHVIVGDIDAKLEGYGTDEEENVVNESSGNCKSDEQNADNGVDTSEETPADEARDSSQEVCDKEIGNFCRFQCPQCKKLFQSFNTVLSHVSRYRACCATTGCKVKPNDVVVRAAYHTCRICDKEVLNDRGIFRRHILDHGARGMSLDDYCRNFGIKNVPMPRGNLNNMIGDALEGKEKRLTDFVGDMCQFRCPTCLVEFGRYRKFREHKNTLSHGIRTPITKAIVKLWHHKCRICDEIVISDSHFLAIHFKHSHRMTPMEYVQKFNLTKYSASKLREEEKQSILQVAETSKDIGNLCTFKCKVCSLFFHSLAQLHYHLAATKHGEAVFDQMSLIQMYISKLVCHNSNACGKIMICDGKFLKNHLCRRHKLRSLQAYAEKYDLSVIKSSQEMYDRRTRRLGRPEEISLTIGNHCEFRCPSCNLESNSWHAMKRHFGQTGHNKSVGSIFKESIMKHVFYQCKLCERKVICDSWIFATHLNRHHKGIVLERYQEKYKECKIQRSFSKNIGNLCKYTCDRCKIVMTSSRSMARLLKQLGHGEWTAENRRVLLTRRVTHRCQICQKDIMCELDSINNHMRRIHNIKLREYEKRFQVKKSTSIQSKAEQNKVDYEDLIREIPTFPALDKKVAAKGAIPKRCLTKHLGNLCRYKCPLCKNQNSRISSSDNLHRHVRRTHKVEKSSQPSANKFIAEARYTECLVCGKARLCETLVIKKHLRHHEDISFGDYVRFVGQNGGVFYIHLSREKLAKKQKECLEMTKKKRALKCSVQL